MKIIKGAKYGEILGAHIVGPHATELIHELLVARENEYTVEEIAKLAGQFGAAWVGCEARSTRRIPVLQGVAGRDETRAQPNSRSLEESTMRTDGPIRHPRPIVVSPCRKVFGWSTVSGPIRTPTSM